MKKICIVLFIAFPLLVQTQNPSIQDCLGAIPVCQQVYEEELSPIGTGNVNEINGAISCISVESNSIWYVFTVNNSGDFGFLLTPNEPTDDYDWALFNITDANCEDIFTDGSLLVSCNATGGFCNGPTGATGDTEFSIQGANCNNFPPSQLLGFSPFNDLVEVEEGNTYVLFINNFTGSTNGYTLDFGLSASIGIFDEDEPFVERAGLSEACSGDELSVTFSEFIQCSTLSSSNFQLNGPGGPYTLTLSSVNCDAGGAFSKDFTLAVSPPIATDGDFSLTLEVDGNTEALDLCDNPAQDTSFMIAGPGQTELINLGNDTILCEGAVLLLDAGQLPGTYLWSNGSTNTTIEVQAAGLYAVTVSTDCFTATDSIEVGYSAGLPPISLGGDVVLCPTETVTLDVAAEGASYVWQDGSTGPAYLVTEPGTYAVTVSNDCEELMDEVQISYTLPIDSEIRDTSICSGNDFTWDVTSANATYLWQDGSAGPVYLVNAPGTYSVTISNACETAELFAEVQLQDESSLPDIDLGNDTTLCPGERLVYEFNFPDVTVQWQDGTTEPVYEITQPGFYSLTVSNECESRFDSLRVEAPQPVSINLGKDTVLCPGETLLLDATSTNATYYQWQDNSTEPTFLVRAEGVYTVVAGNECEAVSANLTVTKCETCNIFVPNSFSPNNDGKNDFFKPYANCEVVGFQLEVFNRWGALIFETNDYEMGWDGISKGKLAPNGVYAWAIAMVVEENGGMKEINLAGDVTILK